MDFGAALGGLGSILGGMGGKKQKAQPTSGYATLPQPVKDAYEKTYLPAVMDYFNSPYHNTPMIRAEAFESDPRFASKAAQRAQEYSDAIGGLFTPYDNGKGDAIGAASTSGASGAGSLSDLYGMMMLQSLAGQGGMYETKQNTPWLRLLESGNMDKIGKTAKEIGSKKGVKGQGGFGGTVIDPATGLPIDFSAIFGGM